MEGKGCVGGKAAHTPLPFSPRDDEKEQAPSSKANSRTLHGGKWAGGYVEFLQRTGAKSRARGYALSSTGNSPHTFVSALAG